MRQARIARLLVATLGSVLLLLASATGAAAQSGAETPDQLLQAMSEALASGDGDTVAALIDQQSEIGIGLARAMRKIADIVVASKRLEDAAVAKFGPGAAAIVRGGTGASPAESLQSAFSNAEVEIEGERATVTAPGQQDALRLVRRDLRWYVDPYSMASQGGATTPAQRQQVVVAMDKTFSAMLAVVEDHTILDDVGSTEELQRTLATRVMTAMLAAMSESAPPP